MISLSQAWSCLALLLAASVLFRGLENLIRFREDPMGRRLAALTLGLGIWAAWGAMGVPPLASPWWALCVLGTAESVRAYGLEQGGSDTMSLWLRALVALFYSLRSQDPAAVEGLAYLVVALLLASYVGAGLAKLRIPAWWNGEALRVYLHKPVYRQSEQLLSRIPAPFFAPMAWVVLIFELSAPMVLLWSDYLPYWAALGLLFHLGNLFCFGLHRFLWVWVGVYPLLFALAT